MRFSRRFDGFLRQLDEVAASIKKNILGFEHRGAGKDQIGIERRGCHEGVDDDDEGNLAQGLLHKLGIGELGHRALTGGDEDLDRVRIVVHDMLCELDARDGGESFFRFGILEHRGKLDDVVDAAGIGDPVALMPDVSREQREIVHGLACVISIGDTHETAHVLDDHGPFRRSVRSGDFDNLFSRDRGLGLDGLRGPFLELVDGQVVDG